MGLGRCNRHCVCNLVFLREVAIPSVRNLLEYARLIAGVFVAGAALGGCALIIPQTEALREVWPDGLAPQAELSTVPFFPQDDYQCGPAALATTLAYFDVKVIPEDLVDKVYLEARQGSLQVEMLASARRYGMVSYQLAPRFEDLLREIAAGHPVIVLQDFGVWPISIWHYAVVVGYDRLTSELILRSAKKPRLVMPFAVLEYTWKESGYWAMVTVPPDRIPVTATASRYLDAIVALERVADPRTVMTGYATFLRRWPGNVPAEIGLANAHHARGELQEAEAALRRAAEREPNSVIVLNNLAQTVSDEGRHGEALQLIDRAVAIDGPFAADARDTRALILQRIDGSKREHNADVPWSPGATTRPETSNMFPQKR